MHVHETVFGVSAETGAVRVATGAPPEDWLGADRMVWLAVAFVVLAPLFALI